MIENNTHGYDVGRIAADLTRGVNISLVGSSGAGKTAAARAALEIVRAEAGMLVAEVSVGEAETFENMLRDAMEQFYSAAGAKGIAHRVLDREIAAIRSAEGGYTMLKSHAELFLNRLRKLDARAVIFADDFDAAAEVFCGERFYYEFLRNLANSSEFSVSLLLASRRDIGSIEVSAFGSSTLFGVFSVMEVK